MNALDTTWQEEVAEDISLEDTNALDVDISNDFSDLLVEPPIHESRQGLSATEDLGMLFGDDAADFSQPDAADADMSDLLDMFDDETDESLLSEPEAENNLTAMTASTAAMDAPGFDELNDFFDEFEGDDVVSLTPVADSSRAIADDSDRPGFDDMFAASATDEIGSRAASLEAEVESDSLFDASEVTESFETPIAAGSFSLDDNLSSDPWSEDTSFSSPVSQDSPENPSFFQPEEIGDPWGGGSETQAFLEIETPTGGSEPNAVLNDLLEETQIAEADLPDLSSDFFTESVADEDLDSDDWQFADENALIESLDETADFDFDLSGFESPVTSGSDPEASDDFNDPLLEDPLQLSQELEVLDDSSSGSEDLSLVMDSLEIPDSADEEPGIDSTGIDIETGEIADPFAAGAELSSPMLSANSAEADSAGLSSPEVSLDVLELEDSEDNFSSIFEEDIESEEIQLTAASENFSELLHQAENLSALETDDADVDEDFAGLFGAGDSSDNEAEISSELDTLDFGAIASEASATDNDLDRLSGDEWALSDLEGWQEPESDPSEFDSLLDDSLDSLDETASGPDVLDTLALDDLDDPDDLTQSETISTDLDSLFDEPFDLEADSTPTDLSTAEELEVDLWDVPAASARGELEEITGHDDADTELWADLTAPENSGSQDDWLEAEPTETSGWANETDLSREPFDSDLPETDPDDDFDLAVSADSTAIAVAESIFDADDALAADLTAAADADGLEEPGFAAEVGGDTDSTDDAVLFEAQFEQNQIDTAEESFADLDFLLEEPDSQLELDQTLIADMTEADLDSEDLATSITLTELTDGLLEPAAEMSVETQDEADFSDLEALLDLEDSEDPEDPATSEPRADTDNDDFDDLEALLDDSAAEASPNTAVGQPLTEMTASDADDFSDLEALLDVEAEVSAPALATPETLSTADFEENSNEFEDLERLLEEADQTLGGGTSASSRSTPQRSRRPARRGGSVLGDQTMRVSVNHLDNLSNLVGELVVNRNTLEQDQERLRQFLDNLMSQVQQLNDVGQRIRDLYERSLLESSLISSR
ncbi:MAG: hypothetical protein HC839_03985, partial [Leptolyngbyaceae cyanobacterium RM2_2_21]|nr:hypothetical protein [Leptolyngbyaceae cyanobacterium RM2_2_21]